jgi:hypothetical protein
MGKHPEFIVTNTNNCKKIIQKLFDDVLQGHDSEEAIGLDCEGVNLGDIRTGYLTLVQLSTWEGHVYLFDVLANPDLLTEGRLGDLLQSSLITKVIQYPWLFCGCQSFVSRVWNNSHKNI